MSKSMSHGYTYRLQRARQTPIREHLRYLSIYGGILTPEGFMSLVRFYWGSVQLPNARITQVGTPEKAVAILRSFFGLGQRDIDIGFRSLGYNKNDPLNIWFDESVSVVLKELEKEGVVINFTEEF